MVPLHRIHQRRVPRRVEPVQHFLGALFEQEAHDLRIASSAGHVQRRAPVRTDRAQGPAHLRQHAPQATGIVREDGLLDLRICIHM
jgi:hypothetical protein